jgi:esterase/lipase superfamily enzyme
MVGTRKRLMSTLLGLLMVTGIGVASPALAGQPLVETVFVASARLVDGPGSLAVQNSGDLHLVSIDVSIPAAHRPGGVSADFKAIGSTPYPSVSAFANAAARQSRSQFGTREVLVYVHGYNTGYDESVIRAAQIAADLDLPSTMVLFSWPAANRLDAYGPDVGRSHQASRNLEVLLRGLAGSGVSRIVIMAHSLGADLATDTLARMAKNGAGALRSKLGGLVLLSPDVSMDDFTPAMRRIEKLGKPVIIFASKGDWALQLLTEITDQELRLGSISDPAMLSDLPLTLVDVSKASTDLIGHFPIATQPKLIALINRLKKPDLVGLVSMLKRGEWPGTVVEQFGRATYIGLPKLPR